MQVQLEKMDERLIVIENKPGALAIKSYLFIFATIATAIVGVLVGKVIK
jgi:hypothetical protein